MENKEKTPKLLSLSIITDLKKIFLKYRQTQDIRQQPYLTNPLNCHDFFLVLILLWSIV